MDRDQIIYKLKSAIEEGKLQAFEQECNESISQIDSYIKKLCKNNYMEFLQSLTSVGEFKEGVKEIRKQLQDMNGNIQQIDKDYFQKAVKSLEHKKNYYNICESVREFQAAKRVVEKAKKIESLIEKDILSVAFHELDILKDECQGEKINGTLKQWIWRRINTIDEKIFEILKKQKFKILTDLENLEMEAGTQVIDEVKRYLQFLGKQFMLESDQDMREAGPSMYSNKNGVGQSTAAAAYMGMKKSQVFQFARGSAMMDQRSSTKKGNQNLMMSMSNMLRSTGKFNPMQPRFQDRESLAQLAFSQIGLTPKYDSPKQQQRQSQFGGLLKGSMAQRDNNASRDTQQYYTLEAIQKQVNIAQEIVVDIDFVGIDNTRKLFKNIDQESLLIDFLDQERTERILKLSKLPRRMKMDECLTRMIGFFVIQIHLTYSLPQMFDADKFRNQWESSLLQIQKSLEQIVMDFEYQSIIQAKKDIVVFVLSMRDLGLIQDLSFLNTLIKLHDIFIDKLLNNLEKKVNEVLDNEDYNQIQVNNAEELFRTVDKYEIDLSKYFGMQNQMQSAYPVYLPYSMSIVKLNDLIISYIEENFQYWQFLLADKADFTLAYSSCDNILICIKEILGDHFFSKNKFTILQRAQFCSNMEYFLKSFGYFKKSVFQLANSGAYNFNKDIYAFQFQSESMMNNFKVKCEESVFTELRQKISDFLSILEGLQFKPKKPDPKQHDFVEDLVQFLRSTIVALDMQNKDLARSCYLITFQHLSSRITELLANSKAIQQINQAGILNLYQDYLFLTKFAKEQMVENQQTFELGMGELQQLTSLFLESSSELGVKEILDDDTYRKKYSKVNLRKLVLILEKYKNDKIAGGGGLNPEIELMISKMPKIKKSDAQSVAKKLRESLNFQK